MPKRISATNVEKFVEKLKNFGSCEAKRDFIRWSLRQDGIDLR